MTEGSTPPVMDWGLGRYESTAESLRPVAHVVVETARVEPGERVLDLGCGTGNAAVLAAAAGASVTGVDPAARLLDVARARSAAEGHDVTFLRGEAAAIPTPASTSSCRSSGSSSPPDPVAAAAEIARVATAGGRVVSSAWLPRGTLAEFTNAAGEAVRETLGAPPPPPPFAWHDRGALAALLAPHGFSVELAEHTLPITDASPAAYLDGQSREHPMAVAGLAVLEKFGRADDVRRRLLEILETGNEDSARFRITSRYVVATARRAVA